VSNSVPRISGRRQNAVRPSTNPVLIDVPAFDIVTIDGSGFPTTSSDFRRPSALYATSYPVVMSLKKAAERS
jgi:hypothetical protein